WHALSEHGRLPFRAQAEADRFGADFMKRFQANMNQFQRLFTDAPSPGTGRRTGRTALDMSGADARAAAEALGRSGGAEAQTRLLRVLSDGKYYRVGGHEPLEADVRIIAATHQNLETLVSDNRFREDLFHRLNVIRIHLPNLCDRSEDIPTLLEHFLAEAARELGEEMKVIPEDTMNFLVSLPWQGNVRQLENFSRWITVMATGREVLLDDLPLELRSNTEQTEHSDQSWDRQLRKWAQAKLKSRTFSGDGLLTEAQPLFERIMIEAALDETAGRKRDASLLLGWGRNTLTRKMQELGMDQGDASDA
ncbi:MAG: hypothetical protein EBY55_09065, partial [Gammaproteobacteria bacterium]|nr:hypothetical protein [Gammaproteobacteria bacterium]